LLGITSLAAFSFSYFAIQMNPDDEKNYQKIINSINEKIFTSNSTISSFDT
jgi:hypothetical protein